MNETKTLVGYLRDIHYDTLDSATIDTTKKCIQDLIGVSMAGSVKPESRIWRQYYADKPEAAQACVWEPDFPMMCVEHAAALNAVYGHVMDLDDVHNASITHMGVITIPTAMALAQKLHASGKEVIAAVVAGYETGARVGEAINPSSYKYWHTTGVVGAVSAAVTAGKLLDLTEEQMLSCLGSAGTQASGLWEFLESGTMSKVLHTANGNLCGIRSAELAKLGFTGAPTILEGERALIQALAPEYDLEALTRQYDGNYRINTNSFKPYACCRHTHSANYCIEKILKVYDLNPEDIVSITDDTYSTAVQTTDNPYPENPYAAKFSLQYCIAAAIILKDLSDRAFTEELINRKDIRNLMSKIRIHVNKQLDDEFHADPNQWSHRLTITLRDGTVITEQVDYPIGDFQNPFDWDMADGKFINLTRELLGSEQAHALKDRLHHLEELHDINELFHSFT